MSDLLIAALISLLGSTPVAIIPSLHLYKQEERLKIRVAIGSLYFIYNWLIQVFYCSLRDSPHTVL